MMTRTEDKIVTTAKRMVWLRQELDAALLRYNKTRADLGKPPLVLGVERKPMKEKENG